MRFIFTPMKSPVASHRRLERIELETGLTAFRCPETDGHWIRAEHYWRWQGRQPESSDASGMDTETAPVSEYDDALKLCPDTGTMMLRYRVGHGLPFRIDRSATGGIWLDGGEWEALKSGNLERNLHMIFTAPWQKAVRDQQRAESAHARLAERLGPDLFARLQSLKAELDAHPQRDFALAYLLDPSGAA